MISKENQIIEIKECIDAVYGADCAYYDVDGFAIANEIYNAGFRKQSEPKKPRFYDVKFRQRGTKYGEFVTLERAYNCPKCNLTVWEKDKDAFCKHCGQPLDWSDHPTEKGGVKE